MDTWFWADHAWWLAAEAEALGYATELAEYRAHHPRPGYRLAGGVPWPTFSDGTDWVDCWEHVTPAGRPERHGRILWCVWAHPDGTHMPGDKRTTTKGLPNPGAWWAQVDWVGRDDQDFRADPTPSKIRLDQLLPSHPAA